MPEKQNWDGERIIPHAAFLDLPGDHVMRYLFAKKFVPGKVVLDAACGAGYGAKFLADNGTELVIGVDISHDAIGFAKRSYAQDSLGFCVQDVTNLAFPDKTFDVIVSFEAIEHIHDDKKYLRELARCLKADGLCIISTPNKLVTSPIWKTPPNKWHIREYRPKELERILNIFFSQVLVQGEHVIDPKQKGLRSGYKVTTLIHPFFLHRLPQKIKDLYSDLLYGKERSSLGKKSNSYADYTIDDRDLIRSSVLIGVCRAPKCS